MEKKIFAIRDSKSESYNQPFFNHTHGEAERNFAQLASDPKSTVNQFPEDFDLFYLGTYNDQTGEISPLQTPQHVVKALTLKTRQ